MTGVARIAAIVVAMVESGVRIRWACGARRSDASRYPIGASRRHPNSRAKSTETRACTAPCWSKKPLRAGRGEHAFVPDVRMNVEALAPVEAEAHEFRGFDVVTRQRERDQKGLPVEREEELSAVRMVVRMPQQDPLRRSRVIGIGALGIFAVREDVVAADGRVAPVEDVTFPFADERAFGRTALIAGVGIDGPRALRRPAHDLDLAVGGIVDEKTVAFERRRRRVDHAHRDARQVRRKVGIQIVDGVRHGDSRAEGNVSTVEFSGGARAPILRRQRGSRRL